MPVNAKKKIAATKRGRSTDSKSPSGVLAQYNCVELSYDLYIPRKLFDTRKFFKDTGMNADARWTAAISPQNSNAGYHVHFKVEVHHRNVHLTVEYFAGASKVTEKDSSEPFAESLMPWLGQYVSQPRVQANSVAKFQKAKEEWRSRFNLPFRVQMSGTGQEVAIEGVALAMPKNSFRVTRAFLAQPIELNHIYASVYSERQIEFSLFRIEEEVVSYNEAVKMVVEETK